MKSKISLETFNEMTGSMLGNIINIILDPLFILGCHWNITGIALATLIGNIISAVYFIIYFTHGESMLSISPKDFTVKNTVCVNVLAIGVPAALGSLTMGISSMFLNRLMTNYGDMALAGIGVAGKLTMISGMLCMGIIWLAKPSINRIPTGLTTHPWLGAQLEVVNLKPAPDILPLHLLFHLML